MKTKLLYSGICFFVGILVGIFLLFSLGYEKKSATTIEVPLDNLKAVVIPTSTRLTRGQTYFAQIGLMITNARQAVFVNDELIQDGLLQYRVTEKGLHYYEGEILLRKNDGSTREYPFRSEYAVENPSFAMSADLMNILFAGIENPISVVTPFPEHRVKLTVEGGQIRRENPWWVVRPSKEVENLIISVYIVDGEKEMLLGTQTFRVKPASEYFEYFEIKSASEKMQ